MNKRHETNFVFINRPDLFTVVFLLLYCIKNSKYIPRCAHFYPELLQILLTDFTVSMSGIKILNINVVYTVTFGNNIFPTNRSQNLLF